MTFDSVLDNYPKKHKYAKESWKFAYLGMGIQQGYISIDKRTCTSNEVALVTGRELEREI